MLIVFIYFIVFLNINGHLLKYSVPINYKYTNNGTMDGNYYVFIQRQMLLGFVMLKEGLIIRSKSITFYE